MITKNGSIYMVKACLCRATLATGEITLLDGTTNSVFVSNSTFNFAAFKTGGTAGMKVIAGVGNTAPTYNDYCLDETEIEGQDISNFIHTTFGAIGSDTLGQYNISATFTNISDRSVTIREIGIVAETGTGTNQMATLISRDVVPDKVLAPSDTVSFTITLSPLTIRALKYAN